MKESAITVIPILQAVTEDEKSEKKLQTETGEHKHSRDGQRKRNLQRNLRPKGQRERRKTKDSCHGIRTEASGG